MTKHNHKVLTPEEVSKLSEEIYSGLVRLSCTLQVFKPLQKSALHDEDYENLEVLHLLHRDLLRQCEELDVQATDLRRSVDTKAFNNAWKSQVAKTLNAERADQRTQNSA